MKFSKFIILIGLISITLGLAACGGSSSGSTASAASPALDLTVSAPAQYPAGLSAPVGVYLLVTNNSTSPASNLYYTVVDNTLGVDVTVQNGANQPCSSIPAKGTCNLLATVAPGAGLGSFSLDIQTQDSLNKYHGVLAKLNSLFNNKLLAANASNVNIAFSDVPANNESGANGITYLYPSQVNASSTSPTTMMVVAYVNSPAAGSFNTVNLTNQNGSTLNAVPVSGNSGSSLAPLSQGSLVTMALTVPAGVNNVSFYGQTANNNTVVSQGTKANTISISNAKIAILANNPLNFSLSASKTSQVVTVFNLGSATASDFRLNVNSPLSITNNTCIGTIAPSTSCRYTINFNPSLALSGTSSVPTNYYNGVNNKSIVPSITVNYTGNAPTYGLTLTSSDNPQFNFATNTIYPSQSSQLTISNSGSSSENNIGFVVPPYFSLTPGTTNSCTLVGSAITNTLQANESCSLTLTYTNNVVTSATTGVLGFSYYYDSSSGSQQQSGSINLSYITTQLGAMLDIDPAVGTFDNIIANGVAESHLEFVVTNHGNGPANNVAYAIVDDAQGYYSIVESGIDNACGNNTLAAGESCAIIVKFGPTNSINFGIIGKLTVAYDTYATVPALTQLGLSGNAIGAVSADIILADASISPAPDSGDGSQESAYQIPGNGESYQLSLTYTNSGGSSAESFTLDTSNLPNYYSVESSDSTCGNVTLYSGSSCRLVLNINTSQAGALNLSLESTVLSASWTDVVASYSNQAIYWQNAVSGSLQNTVYVNAYPIATVLAGLFLDSGGKQPASTVTAGSNFYAVFKVSGGSLSSAQTYSVGPLPSGMAFEGGVSDCTLGEAVSSCAVQILSDTAVPADYTINFIGGVPAPSPESAPITVTPAPALGKILFATPANASGGNLGGIAGADGICQSQATTLGLSGTYKAMLVDGVNRVACTSNDCTNGGTSEHVDWVLTSNTQYVQADGTTIIGTTNSNGIFPLYPVGDLTNPIGGDYTVFTGINAGNNNDWTSGTNCNAWSSNATDITGNYGFSSTTLFYFYYYGSDFVCGQNLSIYCAQQ